MIYKDLNEAKFAKMINSYIDNAEVTVDTYYTRMAWYKSEKKHSFVMGIMLKYAHTFMRFGFSVDDAVKTLCSLYNFSNVTTFHRLPDRYLTMRNKLSKSKTEKIIYLLSKTSILDIDYDNSGYTLVKLNRKLLNSDNYFIIKCKQFFHNDYATEMKCQDEIGTVLYSTYSNNFLLTQRKRHILGLTVAYNKLLEDYLMSNDRLALKNEGKLREDISYVEIPISVISRVLRIKEKNIMKYVHKLYDQTNYIAQHNEIYIDTEHTDFKGNTYIEPHYINSAYRNCKLENATTATLEEGHPDVTEYSAIIFNGNFKKSKTGQYVEKHLYEYMEYVKRELYFMSIDKDNIFTDLSHNTINEMYEYISENGITEEDTLKQLPKPKKMKYQDDDNNQISFSSTVVSGYEDFSDTETQKEIGSKAAIGEILNPENKIGSLIDTRLSKMQIKSKKKIEFIKIEKINNFSFKTTCGVIRKVLNILMNPDLDEKYFNYYLERYTLLEKHFKSWLKTFDNNPDLCNKKQIDELIQRYDLYCIV